ncbi:ATP synthase F(0) complex subunit k, mitochondrial-like [Saccoglossus kowalevskii]
MAGGMADESQFAHYTGLKKYFNSDTVLGKRNCVIATFAGSFLIYWVIKSRLNKRKAITAAAVTPKTE